MMESITFGWKKWQYVVRSVSIYPSSRESIKPVVQKKQMFLFIHSTWNSEEGMKKEVLRCFPFWLKFQLSSLVFVSAFNFVNLLLEWSYCLRSEKGSDGQSVHTLFHSNQPQPLSSRRQPQPIKCSMKYLLFSFNKKRLRWRKVILFKAKKYEILTTKKRGTIFQIAFGMNEEKAI